MVGSVMVGSVMVGSVMVGSVMVGSVMVVSVMVGSVMVVRVMVGSVMVGSVMVGSVMVGSVMCRLAFGRGLLGMPLQQEKALHVNEQRAVVGRAGGLEHAHDLERIMLMPLAVVRHAMRGLELVSYLQARVSRHQ